MKTSTVVLRFLFGLCLLTACHTKTQETPDDFIQTIGSENKPWTHTKFDTQKFSFAIFGDLTGGERPEVFNVAIAQMNLLRPDFILNVGDLIEGEYSNIEELSAQWEAFDSKVKLAKAPVFYVAGNHDLTNTTMWEEWDKRYGQRYYHFRYKNALFLVLNSEDHTPERVQEIFEIRKKAMARLEKEGPEIFGQTEYANIPEQIGGKIGAAQASYFKKAIEENTDVHHTFVFVHKAPWKTNDAHFLTIEKALSGRPYTVFNGHAHTYAYETRFGHDYIRLSTTGGMQFAEEDHRSVDHFTMVTVDSNKVDIANLLLAGVLNKKGEIPNRGDSLCFEKGNCK